MSKGLNLKEFREAEPGVSQIDLIFFFVLFTTMILIKKGGPQGAASSLSNNIPNVLKFISCLQLVEPHRYCQGPLAHRPHPNGHQVRRLHQYHQSQHHRI